MTGINPGATREGAPAIVLDPRENAPEFVPAQQTVILEDRPAPSQSADEPDPRDAIEDAAAKKLAAARQAEFGSIPVETVSPPPVENNVPQNKDPTEPPAPAPVVTAPPPVQTIRVILNGQAQEIPADAKVVMKVNGVEQEVPVGEVLKSGQIEREARRRLGEATTKLADADRILAQARQQAAPQPAAPPAPAPAVDDAEAIAKEFLAVLNSGTEAEVLAAVKKVVAAKAPALSPDEIRALAREESQRQVQQTAVQRDLDQTFTRLATDHPAVFQDERLAGAVAIETTKRLREDLIEAGGDPRIVNTLPPEELSGWHAKFRQAPDFKGRQFTTILKQAAESVENDFVKPRQVTPPAPQATATNARLEAKRAAPQQPASATARTTTAAPPPKKARDLIAEERASRAVA